MKTEKFFSIRKIKTFSIFIISCLQFSGVTAQSGPGWPLTPAYSKWISWAKNPDTNMLKSVRAQIALPNDFSRVADSIVFQWEGEKSGTYKCSDPTRILRIRPGPSPTQATLIACLRSFDYSTEFFRAFFILSNATAHPDYYDEKVGKAAGAYIDYLQSIIRKDIEITDNQQYQSFCTYEFFSFIALSTDAKPDQCATPQVIDRYSAVFIQALPTAFFAPKFIKEFVINGSKGEINSNEWVKNWFYLTDQNFSKNWIFPVLHEIGHIANCHVGPVGPQKCDSEAIQSSELNPTALNQPELEADIWALRQLLISKNPEALNIAQSAISGQTNLLLALLRFNPTEEAAKNIDKRARQLNAQLISELRKITTSPSFNNAAHQDQEKMKNFLNDLEAKNSKKIN